MILKKLKVAVLSLSLSLSVTVSNSFAAYELGNVDGNEVTDASDASLILTEYASLSTTGISVLSDEQRQYADTNKDEIVDASDATNVLTYYSYLSTGGVLDIEKYLIKRDEESETAYTYIVTATATTAVTTTAATTVTTTETTTSNTTTAVVTIDPEIYKNAYLQALSDFTNSENYYYDHCTYYVSDVSGDGIPELFINYELISGSHKTDYYIYNGSSYVLDTVLSDNVQICSSKGLIQCTAYEGNEVHYYYSIESDGSLTLDNQLMYGYYNSSYYVNGSKSDANDYYALINYYNAFRWIEPEANTFDDVPNAAVNKWKNYYISAAESFYNIMNAAGTGSTVEFALIYINDDDIPELYANSFAGGELYTFADNKLVTVHTWDSPRASAVYNYSARRNMFTTYSSGSAYISGTAVWKILSDGTKSQISTVSCSSGSYYVNGSSVSKSQFDASMQWIDDNFTAISRVNLTAIKQQIANK